MNGTQKCRSRMNARMGGSLPIGNQSEAPRDEYHGLPNPIPSQDNEAPRQ
jgi:hypothetical protein